ncbi:MAG: hypothetical protein E6K79_00995 [Candidatus Eisenbacteria bacterium]|uniref:MASE9 domain-containing protein n=1 Tax=Eiseniibacteriota bacterium TaxID=2212470 RepID=A0A538TTT4_UNCEI|nr:MAG: hypothetical protein E6K79_00995 [Candidatus Eisenbacteria bacterium]
MILMAYVALVAIGGAWAVLAPAMPNPAPAPLEILFWLLANMLGEVLWLPAPRGRGYISMATAANFASVLVLPTWTAVVVTSLAGALTDAVFRHRPWYKVLFNAAACCVTVYAASHVYASTGNGHAGIDALLTPLNVGALALAAVVYFGLNTWLVSGAIALEGQRPVWEVWRTSFGSNYSLSNSLALILFGFFFATLFLTWGYISAFLAVFAAYFVRDAYERYLLMAERGAAT